MFPVGPAFWKGGAAAGNPYLANAIVLLHFNEASGAIAFTDKVTVNNPIVNFLNSGTRIATTNSFGPFSGTNSITCVGLNSGNNLQFIGNAGNANLLGSDFSIRAWVRPTNITGQQNVFGDLARNRYVIGLSAGQPYFECRQTGGTTLVQLIGSSALPVNTPAWIGVTRQGNVWTLWANGSSVASVTTAGSIAAVSSSNTMNVAGGIALAMSFVGQIAEVEGYKGVVLDLSVNPTAPFLPA